MRALGRAPTLSSLLVAGAALLPPAAPALASGPLLPDVPVAGLLIARLAPPRVTLPALGEGEVRMEVDPGGRLYQEGTKRIATGGVTVIQGNTRLTADNMTYDVDTGDVVAEGNVVFTEPGYTVRGERITYNTGTRQVHAESAETVVNGVIIRARAIDADPSKYTAGSASVTTCDRPRPHYRLTARTITITPNDRIVARHVGVWLLGARLFEVPEVTAHIGGGQGDGGPSLLPRFGRDSHDGFYLAKVLPLIQSPRLYVDVDSRLSVKRGLLGGFDTAAPAGKALQLIGALKYRDIASNQRTGFTEVDRLPEIGLLWVSPPPAPRAPRRRPARSRGAHRGGAATPELEAAPVAEPVYRPLAQVGSDAEHQPALLRPPEPGRWYLRAQTTLGYFHQHEADVNSTEVPSLWHGRLDFRATGSRAGLRIAGLSLPVLQLFLRQSYYGEGSAYSVVGVGARREWRLTDHWSSGLQSFAHYTSGQTPFQWDQVEIRNELQPAFTYTAGGTTLRWVYRFDLDRSQVFNQVYSIARVFHCVEPRLSYSTRHSQIYLDVRIVGLQFE
jgi:hypothetical protein